MSNIAKTSDALQARIRALCGDMLHEVTSHPGHWDDSAVARIVSNPPAVYTAWLGHMPGENPHIVQARWAVYVVANVLDGQREDDVGIYQLVERLSAGLHRYPLTQVELYSTAESSQGMNRWGAMDGIYWLPGIGTLALDTIKTKDGRKLIVFNDAYRVTTTSYFAMEIE
ncbi:phage protein Gp37 [Aggregatibacter actinomycetemcomitans]|uniref:phage protein Gp37 n=1 Tax=Aggregatibacter actinomycetemcomitans TaxID=714 RepID=UPI00201DB317|nr:phage protein Gp37 [Aggregatibacter actinomycetemcomitans]